MIAVVSDGDLKLQWDWNPKFCVPPFVVTQRMRADGIEYVPIKGRQGWNVLAAMGELPPGTTWEELGNNLLALVEMRYSQEEINDGHAD